MEQTVKVWGKPHVVNVYQKSKSVWIAVGEYRGEVVEVRGRSESAAVAQWRRAAEYKGN